MSESSRYPTWAPSLRNVVDSLGKQTPRPLLPGLELFSGQKVSEADLVDFLENANYNDTVLQAMRLAFAEWDGDPELDVHAGDGAMTIEGTPERRALVVSALGLSAEAGEVLDRLIPVRCRSSAIVISKQFEPWYDQTRHERSSMYWDHYRDYLTHTKGWPANSISALDRSTHDVVERLTDPIRADIKQTKGLVVGYVQSGKTANFTGVIAKAIDAGYRLIVVMTGTIELLRAQTQRRIDMELMGVENVLAGQDPNDPDVATGLDYQSDEDWINRRFVEHGDAALDQPGVARIRRVTTHHHDYKSLPQGMSQLRYERHDRTKPLNHRDNLFHTDAYVVVVKKNSAPLKKLIKDLGPLRSMLAELPALLIDDESDLASVNTKDPRKSRERTQINRLIRELMEKVPRAQYVGYTATPFANVFIDPDDATDLFPSDFVLSLPRPEGYMGVQEFHDVDADWDSTGKSIATSNEKAFIRDLTADPNRDPGGRLRELTEAVDAWVLAGVIKLYREAVTGQRFRHHTMLVHETTKTAGQDETAAIVRKIWETADYRSRDGRLRLKQMFEADYLPVMRARAGENPVPATFDDLTPHLAAALKKIGAGMTHPVLIVNSDKQVQENQQALDFDADDVWRILVGGAKLSRGFTVEGLTVSYFRRKAGQADTLMQAGRWFGFRRGYADLVRLYIRRDDTVDLYDAFEALLLDEEAFREELQKYQGMDDEGHPIMEPRQIPPLVSQHLPWLKPTSRNKRFNASIVSRSAVGSFHQLSSIPPRTARKEHQHNLDKVVVPLLENATSEAQLHYDDDGVRREQVVRLGLIDAERFEKLFRQLRWHPDYLDVVGPLATFLTESREHQRITDWAILWPQEKPQAQRNRRIRRLCLEELGVDAPVWKRARRPAPRIDFTGESKRNLLAAGAIAEGREVPVVGTSSSRGVLVISLVADRDEADDTDPVDRDEVVGLISLRAPDRSVRNRRDIVRWSVRSKEATVIVDA